MKKALITMAAMFLVMVWPLGGLWKTILNPITKESTENNLFNENPKNKSFNSLYSSIYYYKNRKII